MTSKEIYEKDTGDKEPNDQIAYYEWHQRYVKWLEKIALEYKNKLFN